MASMEESGKIKKFQRKKILATLNSTDALALVEHGSELTINIRTPVGTKFVCQTTLIGTHTDNYILTEIPNISSDDFGYFFQKGFWSNLRAISPRGEGAVVYFRSQLLHIIQEPVPIALFSVPSTMQVTRLRKEPRFEVNLTGKAISRDHKIDCEIRDISRSGCRFVTSPLGTPYQVEDNVSIQLLIANTNFTFGDLDGHICNVQRSTHYARYGLEFSESGRINAADLLNKLKFTGTKLTLNVQKKK
jgi:hypothetical protein